MQYEAGSAPYLALDATIDRTNKRFANYAKANLLCGTDGLPHLIADPGLALRYGHAGEIFVSRFSRFLCLCIRAVAVRRISTQSFYDLCHCRSPPSASCMWLATSAMLAVPT